MRHDPEHGGREQFSVDYDVGYAKPPKERRFTPGRSGNPRGRPKKLKGPERLAQFYGNDKFHEIVAEEMRRSVKIRDGDRTIEMSAVQALIRSTVIAGTKGDRHARGLATELARDTEREQAKKKEEIYDSWWRHYQEFKPIFDEHEAKGLPAPKVFPNPNDLVFNPHIREVKLIGPQTAEEHQFYMLMREDVYYHKMRVESAGRDYLRARAASKKQYHLERWLIEQAAFDQRNDMLPRRYRYELDHRCYDEGASTPKDDRELVEFISRRRSA